MLVRGARYLTGENLEVVWAEVSGLSYAFLLDKNIKAQNEIGRF